MVKSLSVWATLVLSAAAGSVMQRQESPCSSYTLVNTRGTTAPQGPSGGFSRMNRIIMREKPGGQIYNTVYPADWSFNTTGAVNDIVGYIDKTLAANPQQCFILQGYSQGAAATNNALTKITGPSYDAVKGVLLLSNLNHKAGLSCNIDNFGGTSTKDENGVAIVEKKAETTIPDNWVSKTADVCILGDGVCARTSTEETITPQHLQYPLDPATIELGVKFVTMKLDNSPM